MARLAPERPAALLELRLRRGAGRAAAEHDEPANHGEDEEEGPDATTTGEGHDLVLSNLRAARRRTPIRGLPPARVALACAAVRRCHSGTRVAPLSDQSSIRTTPHSGVALNETVIASSIGAPANVPLTVTASVPFEGISQPAARPMPLNARWPL